MTLETFTPGDDHPAFAGHFPGRPILPGVVLLAEAMAAIVSDTGVPATEWTIANAKFLVAVEPGTALAFSHEAMGPGRIRFEFRTPAAMVASGVLARR
jgi:3-hydroxyacyl-[acyl-carrier-protein] dehydratase